MKKSIYISISTDFKRCLLIKINHETIGRPTYVPLLSLFFILFVYLYVHTMFHIIKVCIFFFCFFIFIIHMCIQGLGHFDIVRVFPKAIIVIFTPIRDRLLWPFLNFWH
jgi:hypothetical protein